MKILVGLIFFLMSLNAYSKHPYYSMQQLINRVVENSNTVFIGKIIDKKEINDGLILDNYKVPIGFLKIEVLRVFKGKIKKNQQSLICTWFDRKEHEFNFSTEKELIFFGVDNGLYILLPSTFGYVFDPVKIDNELTKALKLRSKPIKDPNLIFEIVDSSDHVTRNACNEPDPWEH